MYTTSHCTATWTLQVNHKSTHLGLIAYSAGDHGEDGSLSVCQESKSVGLPANQPTDTDSSAQRGMQGRERKTS